MSIHTNRCNLPTLGTIFLFMANPAWAALPPAPQPTGGAGAGGSMLATIQAFMKDAGLLVALGIALIAFLWVAYHFLADLHEVRTGKKEMGGLWVNGITGGLVIVLVLFLLNQAVTIV